MPFEKGHKLGKGGKQPGAGRPTREEADFKERLRKAVEAELAKNAEKLAKRYNLRALGKRGDKVLLHAIDRAVPAAKQTIEVEGTVHQIVRIKTFDPTRK